MLVGLLSASKAVATLTAGGVALAKMIVGLVVSLPLVLTMVVWLSSVRVAIKA